MNLMENLKRYAHLIAHAGCNLQPGQDLLISADIDAQELVHDVAKEAYEMGAREVVVHWNDSTLSRLRYEYAPMEVLETCPEWMALELNSEAERGAAILNILSSDPEAMRGIDPKKMIATAVAQNKACRAFRDGMDFGRNVWCIVGASSAKWAKHVFPDLPEAEAVEKLWEAIFHTVYVDTEDPVAAWEEHRRSFEARSKWLNDRAFDRLHYQNSLGTDITLGLPEGHIWGGGGSQTVGGTYFFPNMPTEEIYTSPDWRRTEGTVVSSKPLNHGGNLIENFSITFHEGEAVSCKAEKGEDLLKEILGTDEGSKRLGECALVPYASPISESGILYYNTLYDENASCHFALGMGFPEALQGGLEMDKEALKKAGVNDSTQHVDFMLGTSDLSITGITKDGQEIPIFRNGNWAF